MQGDIVRVFVANPSSTNCLYFNKVSHMVLSWTNHSPTHANVCRRQLILSSSQGNQSLLNHLNQITNHWCWITLYHFHLSFTASFLLCVCAQVLLWACTQFLIFFHLDKQITRIIKKTAMLNFIHSILKKYFQLLYAFPLCHI